jgi:hypothetical protein
MKKFKGNQGSRYSDRGLRRWLPGLKLARYSKNSRATESKGVSSAVTSVMMFDKNLVCGNESNLQVQETKPGPTLGMDKRDCEVHDNLAESRSPGCNNPNLASFV